MENKDEIIKAFVKALQLTDTGENIVDGEYYVDGGAEEFALLYIGNRLNGRPYPARVNITADSGIAIMKDIIRALE